jgi:hypothetical protein
MTFSHEYNDGCIDKLEQRPTMQDYVNDYQDGLDLGTDAEQEPWTCSNCGINLDEEFSATFWKSLHELECNGTEGKQ